MSSELPKYSAPPVQETVLSVQYPRLEGYTSAHAGSYWSERLGTAWNKVREVDRLDEVEEKFGTEREFLLPRLKLRPGSEPNRLQFVHGTRMIQVQDSRFIYNWIRHEESHDYPSYRKVAPEFLSRWDEFQSFLRSKGIPDPKPNQWEVTYVNHFPKGDLWDSLDEVDGLIRDFRVPGPVLSVRRVDTLRAEWHFELGKAEGRLRVSLFHGLKGGAGGQEALNFKLVARGPTSSSEELPGKLDFGHEAIVLAFTAMTTDRAHAHWGRER